jgi:amino acid adenylation domain-containing protein
MRIPQTKTGPDAFDAVLERTNLTRRQLLMYTGQQLHPGVLLYDAVWAIRLRGIDPDRFQCAFQTLVNSCDALRTVIEERDGLPYQRIQEQLSHPVAQIDLRPTDDPDVAADAWIEQRCRRSFERTQQLFDVALLRTSAEESLWYLNVHHLIADGWAVELLVQKLWEIYRDTRRGALPGRVPLSSFQEHVERERARRRLPEYRHAAAYWQEKLAVPVELPCLYGQTTPRQTTAKQRRVMLLGIQATAQLKALAKREEVFTKSMEATLTNLLGALLLAYVHRVTGQERLSLGVTFHNRVSEEQKQLVGLLMEVLPFLVTIHPKESFLALAQRVRDEARTALQHRHFSVGNGLQAPAYDLFLNSARSLRLPEGQGPARRIFPGHGETSLSLSVLDAADSDNWELWFDVRDDLLDTVGGETLVGHFRTLVEAALADPDQPVAGLPLIAETERRRLLVDWNQTEADYQSEPCIHHMVEAQVLRTPKATAVVCGTQQLTYEELNQRANQRAHYVQQLGVGPERLVGICMERSLDMIVALLGILKAGGAYVPLDRAYPAERLAFMIQDAQLSLLLTQQHLLPGRFPQGTQVVYLDTLQPVLASQSVQNPDSPVAGDHLAYVIYTSGSTGQPKGVLICHRGVCNYLQWRHHYFPLTEADAVLQTASISFDDSVWEIFEPLSVGACLVFAEPGTEYDVRQLVPVILRQQITAVCFVPSLLRAFLEVQGVDDCRGLRRVTTGGETLPVELVERFFAHLSADLYNGYGPTEATIGVTFWKCHAGNERRTVPIGRPIANMQVYVLDDNLEPTPIGMPGELYIGGVGLARGYLNRPELTAERFVANPFHGQPGARLYKTGDRARWVADGNLEFLGRLDDQVKLRGFRIELGEIEAALGQHPGVLETAVALREDVPGAKRLVAYLKTRSEARLSAGELHSFLGQKLPRHMVPAAFVVLDQLPRTPNGKVDRRALPAPDDSRPELAYAAVMPGTPVEKTLAEIWTELLRRERIGIHDNFFELGGDSLLAVRLFGQIERVFGRQLPLSILFQGATIKDLAAMLQATKKPEAQERIVAIQPQGTRPPLFLLPSLTGDLLLWRELVRHLGPDQPCYGLQPAANDEASESLGQLTGIAAVYLDALQRVQPHGPYALVGFSWGGTLAFEMARQLHARGEKASLVAILDIAVTDRAPWSGRRILRPPMAFLLNLRWWVWDDLLHSRPAEILARLRRKVRALAGRPGRKPGVADTTSSELEAIWDLDPLPQSAQKLIARHYQALENYVPDHYPGRILLFRARCQPLFCPGAEPDLGWGKFATGGVQVEVIPGSHETILREPHVRVLAQRLQAGLDFRPLPSRVTRHAPR